MKVIDLLNKIANGEEVPNKIKWKNKIYIERSDVEWYILDNGNFDDLLPIRVIFLNDEIEIIEEQNKIEKAQFQYSVIPEWFERKEIIESVNKNFERHQKAINKIIDYINKGDSNE